MKYCKKCKHIHEDKFDICTECRKPQQLYPIEDENTPVFLLSASGFEAQRVQSALESGGIPSDLAARKNNLSADAVTGSDINDKDILVPYSAYDKAYDICVGIGAIKPEGEEITVDMQDVENTAESEEQVEMTFPPSSPPYQAWMMASHDSSSGVSPIAEPEQFTKITFLPALWSIASVSRCALGNSMLVRSPPLKPSSFTRISSPSSLGEIPPTKITVPASPI